MVGSSWGNDTYNVGGLSFFLSADPLIPYIKKSLLCICSLDMNDTHPQQHAKEEISGAPTFFAEDMAFKTQEIVREPSSWDPRVSLSSKFGENQLDPSLDQQFNELKFQDRNSTISAVEKSFKDEEFIYVSIFFFCYLDLQNNRYFLIID